MALASMALALALATLDVHPGGPPCPPELARRLEDAIRARGPGYVPRTRHRREDGSPRYANRLLLEDSPYLQQHAHNPVDWYPWGPEAFARARAENRPIFLSIGYSTCHWCHVMEEESFESQEIASLLNAGFVCIKVDRERRPDLDDLYMTAVQLMTGRGGWPMSSFLTPEGKPFLGGTYFPPDRFAALLERVDAMWRGRPDAVKREADAITARVEAAMEVRGAAGAIGDEAMGRARRELLSRLDALRGGFGRAPKFPHEAELLFLLRRAGLGDEVALDAAVTTLDAMARGGIHDQVGGGFHRYATDARWLVPHFEKMLYNQALLSRAYAQAYRLTGDERHARVARAALDFVRRDMTASDGLFYSATDADSDGREGAFFVWTPAELRRVLGDADARLATRLWGVTSEGNFEGHSILHLPRPLDEVARELEVGLPDLLTRVDGMRERLREARSRRPPPLRDDKVIAAWNGMMITALAECGDVLGERPYVEAAERAGEALWKSLWRAGRTGLLRVRLGESASVPGVLEDYACVAEGFLALHDVTGRGVWLERARALAGQMLERFEDGERGGFYDSARGADPLLVARVISPMDGAVPSGNAVAVRVLGQIARRADDPRAERRAEAAAAAFAAAIQARPAGFSYLLLALDETRHGAIGPRESGAAGRVRARARLERRPGGDPRLVVEVTPAAGWHVNAHRPLDGSLVPTEVRLPDRGAWQLSEVTWPAPVSVRLGFSKSELLVYDRPVTMTATLAPAARHASDAPPLLPVTLRVQACNDRVCLKPEDLVMELPAAAR